MTDKQESNERRTKAMEKVSTYSKRLAAVGLIPIPLVELPVVSIFQLKMVRDLAQIYEVDFSESLVKSILATLTGVGFTVAAGKIAGSLLKSVPGVGTIVGMATSSAMGGASTYAIGKLFVEHFETGGTLLTINAEKMKEHYEEALSGDQRPKAEKAVSYAGIKP